MARPYEKPTIVIRMRKDTRDQLKIEAAIQQMPMLDLMEAMLRQTIINREKLGITLDRPEKTRR